MGVLFNNKDGKPVLKPNNSYQKQLIAEIERGAINDPLLKENSAEIGTELYQLYTITAMFLRASVMMLDSVGKISICGFIDLERDERYEDSAEKSGNIVGTARPGSIMKPMLERTNIELSSMDILIPGPSGTSKLVIPMEKSVTKEDRDICLRIQTIAAKLLTGYKCSLVPDHWSIYLISWLFLKHSVKIAMIEASKQESGRCSINLADLFEINVKYDKKKDKYSAIIDISKEAKLDIKSDGKTEA